MISGVYTYEVTNTSNSSVFRGGLRIPSNATVTVKVSEYKIKEFTANKHLNVQKVTSTVAEPAPHKSETSKYRINSEGKLQCPHCENDYKTEDGIDKHVATKHGDLND